MAAPFPLPCFIFPLALINPAVYCFSVGRAE